MMKNPVHPGEILRDDVLAEFGLSVSEAASRLGISRVTLSRVLHGHARISPNLAVRLEGAGVGTARAWLAMQAAHDLAAERAAGTPTVHRLQPADLPKQNILLALHKTMAQIDGGDLEVPARTDQPRPVDLW